MTREEATEELKILKENYWDDDGYGHETKQYDDTMFALDMAIEALEQEPTQMIDKSNFSQEQYKTDLQSAYDCGKSVLGKIRAEIDKEYEGLDCYDPHSLGTFACRIDDILDKYKAESEE